MAKKIVKKQPGWDEIGKMIGSKMDKEFKVKECGSSWHKWGHQSDNGGSGFCGRALFIVGLLLALNALGVLNGVNIWIQLLIGIGFALMSF